MPTDTSKFSQFTLKESVTDTDRPVGLDPTATTDKRNVRWPALAWVNYVGKKLSALTATTLQWGGGWVDSQDQDGYTLLEALTPVGSGALGFYFYYDQTSTLQREPVYTNSYTGNPYTTRWQRFNGSASARRFDEARDYAQDELVRFELNDRTDFYSARQELLRTNFPGGIVPAPIGGGEDDDNWLLESGAGQSYQPYESFTYAGAYNASLAGTLPEWKRLRITNRQNPEGDVYAVFLEADTLIASQAWLVSDLTTEGTYDLDTDTFTPNAGGGSGVTITQTPGQSTTSVMSQKAVTDALAGAGSGVLYPATGQNTDGAMTQKATTDALATKAATSHTHTAANISDFATAADLRITTATANNLTTTAAGKVLDARQGKALADRLLTVENDLNDAEVELLALDGRVDDLEASTVLTSYIRPGQGTGFGCFLIGEPGDGNTITGAGDGSTIVGGVSNTISSDDGLNSIEYSEQCAVTAGSLNAIRSSRNCTIASANGSNTIADSVGCTIPDGCERVTLLNCSQFTPPVGSEKTYIDNAEVGTGSGGQLTADQLAAIQGATTPDADNPFATIADVLTPPPLVRESNGGQFYAYQTPEAAFADMSEDDVLDLNRSEMEITADVSFAGTLNGRGRSLSSANGSTLTTTAFAIFNQLALLSGNLSVEVATSRAIFNTCRIAHPLTVAAGAEAVMLQSILNGPITVAGTLTLGAETNYSSATITTTGAGVVNYPSAATTPRDPWDVDATKRVAVVSANAAAVVETDPDYYGREFYDEVTVPGSVTHYRCAPSAQSGGSTIWKWFRTVIE